MIIGKDGYLFYTSDKMNYLLGYVGDDTKLTLPTNYNGQDYEIYKYAFEGCSNLTSVTIPDSVTSIGNYAFKDCSNLTEITFTGTKEQWKNIKKGSYWNSGTGNYTVHCSDGYLLK